LENTDVLIYTPENEHFGIVPVEAMYCGCIPLACNSGGPIESVDDGVTGYLLDPQEPETWADKLKEIFEKSGNLKEMESAARKRVQDIFSFKAFTNVMSETLLSLDEKKSKED